MYPLVVLVCSNGIDMKGKFKPCFSCVGVFNL